MGISTPSNASTVDSIRQIHGSSVANELVEFSISSDKWGFTASGWATNANYHVKKTMLLLFINHRSVESSAIKKSVEQTYSTFLPKGGHPFVYLNLDIDPQRVDVNVHPTKREVNFLNEEEIIDAICSSIRTQLSQVDTSRTFLTQSLLPSSTKTPMSAAKSASSNPRGAYPSNTPNNKPLSNNLIRTDHSLRKITSMLPAHAPSDSLRAAYPPASSITYATVPRAPTTIRLTTIKNLRASVRDRTHAALTAMFATHTYIGLVDPTKRIAAIQAGVKLFLVDYGLLCSEYFYQLGLTDFGNFGTIRFEPALDLQELIELGVSVERVETANAAAVQAKPTTSETDDVEWNEIAPLVTLRLVQRREMLLEYFSMEISADGKLAGLPLLIRGYTPSMTKLPRFLMRLGPCVDWDDEEGCFHSFLQELAAFYAVERLPGFSAENETRASGKNGKNSTERSGNDDAETPGEGEADEHPQEPHTDMDSSSISKNGIGDELGERTREIESALEHVLFPAFRARLIATKALLPGVVEVADLKGLYRVFERC